MFNYKKKPKMILPEDVIGHALNAHLPLTPEKISYVIANYPLKIKDEPTGNISSWIEDLLYECNDDYHIKFINKLIKDILIYKIMPDYIRNPNVCGEFLDGYEISKELNGYLISDYVLLQSLNQLIKWDGTDWRFAFKDNGDTYQLEMIDTIEYKGIIYPTRRFHLKSLENGNEDIYKIATKSLLDNLNKDKIDDEFVDDSKIIDDSISYYVDDEYFYRDANFLVKYNLDMPFQIIED